MRAMLFDGTSPLLRETELPDPVPKAGELLIDVHACGVCRTGANDALADLRAGRLTGAAVLTMRQA